MDHFWWLLPVLTRSLRCERAMIYQ
jgi:hypothetical protein